MLNVVLQYVIRVYTRAIHRHVPDGRQRICFFPVSLWEINSSAYFLGGVIRYPLRRVAVMCYHASKVLADSTGGRAPRSPPWDGGSACWEGKCVLVPWASFCSQWAKHPPCRLGILWTSAATSPHDKISMRTFIQKMYHKQCGQVIPQQKDVVYKRCL